MEMIPYKTFRSHLRELCLMRVSDAIKGIDAINMVERDRGYLLPYEARNHKCFEKQLELNENLLLSIDPEYSKIQ